MSKDFVLAVDGDEVFRFPAGKPICIDDNSEGWRDMLLYEVCSETDGMPISFVVGDRVELPFWGEELECVDADKNLFKVVS